MTVCHDDLPDTTPPRPPTTPDGHYIIVNGRRWRTSDPSIPDALRAELVAELMRARREVRTRGDAARPCVHDAKARPRRPRRRPRTSRHPSQLRNPTPRRTTSQSLHRRSPPTLPPGLTTTRKGSFGHCDEAKGMACGVSVDAPGFRAWVQDVSEWVAACCFDGGTCLREVID